MAKVTRDTGRQSAMNYLAGFGKTQRFKLTAGGDGCSITAEAGEAKEGADKTAAAKAIAKVFDSAPADAVFGVTRDKVGLSVGIIKAAAPAPASSPTRPQTDDKDK